MRLSNSPPPPGLKNLVNFSGVAGATQEGVLETLCGTILWKGWWIFNG